MNSQIKNCKILIFASLFVLTVFVYVLHASEGNQNKLPVFVSIEPQAYFVERIGGSRVSVDVLVHPGENPATYTPTPAQMSKLAKAEIFFRIGVPFENIFMKKIQSTMKHLHIIDTRKGIKLRQMEGRHHHVEKGGNDPHIWLNPSFVKQQAETMLYALIELDPEGKDEYTANYESFVKDLNALNETIKETLASVKGGNILVFHPVLGYFTDAYGLRQIAIEVEGKAPKGRNLAMLIKKARQEDIRVVFIQPQFDKTAAQKIADAINGKLVLLDPLARDYLNNLESMAGEIAAALQ
ncbi:MAG: zinc ABC transporter substrate-binding protein [Thermodesulfobacteriota bacterium]|nr:zinc ABC transporter substrate-binding protein [Thermodesulfobacteriota bacterium]